MDEALDELLDALDETPTTVEGLAQRLDRDPEAVEAGLAELEDEGLAVDWGGLWATTWRAKLRRSPGFFEAWIPASVGLGAGITALAILLHGPARFPVWVAPVLALIAVLGLARGLFPVLDRS